MYNFFRIYSFVILFFIQNTSKMQHLINEGTFLINYENSTSKDEKTIIICGLPRSGTSMMAMLLKNVGIFIGNKVDNAVFEDVEISRMIENNENIDQIIESRNKKHKVWGWKRPNAYKFGDRFLNKLRNPHFIVLFRDHASIAMRRSISDRSDFVKNLSKINKEYEILINFIHENKFPILIVSYEKSLSQKIRVIKSVFDFVGIRFTAEKKQIAINSININRKEYLQKSQRMEISGLIEDVNNGIVMGWFVSNESSHNKIIVELNGKELNILPIYSQSNIPNRIQFKLNIVKFLSLNSKNILSILLQDNSRLTVKL